MPTLSNPDSPVTRETLGVFSTLEDANKRVHNHCADSLADRDDPEDGFIEDIEDDSRIYWDWTRNEVSKFCSKSALQSRNTKFELLDQSRHRIGGETLGSRIHLMTRAQRRRPLMLGATKRSLRTQGRSGYISGSPGTERAVQPGTQAHGNH